MCTQLSADSPLGPQVAPSLRYCQLERGKMEGGRKAGRQGEKKGGREGVMHRAVAAVGVKKVRQEEMRRGMMENRQDRKGECWRCAEGLQTNALQDRR